jgi:alkylation response protein AidB-like acyl-CoA dehydrogenase
MGCALGTGGGMVQSLVAAYAPADVRDHVLAKFGSGEWAGETAQLLTERTGGSDLGALETTATRRGDAWLLNGFKWFASNCNGEAFVVLAKPEGAPDSSRRVRSTRKVATPRRVPQRRAHPAVEGQAGYEIGGVGRDRVRRRRGVPAFR